MWVFISIYVLGGAAIVNSFFLLDIKEPVRTAVADPARVEQVLAIRKEIKQELVSEQSDLDALYEELTALNLRHDAPEKAFLGVKTRLIERRSMAYDRLLDARLRMRKAMTREEWEAVFGAAERTP